MIAAKTASSSMFAIPPPCGRTRAGGNNGRAISHSPSGTIHPHRPLPMPTTTVSQPSRTRSKLGLAAPPHELGLQKKQCDSDHGGLHL